MPRAIFCCSPSSHAWISAGGNRLYGPGGRMRCGGDGGGGGSIGSGGGRARSEERNDFRHDLDSDVVSRSSLHFPAAKVDVSSFTSPSHLTHPPWPHRNSSSQPRPPPPQRPYISTTSSPPPPSTHSSHAPLHPTRSHMSPPTTTRAAQSLQSRRTRLSSTSGHGKRSALSSTWEARKLTHTHTKIGPNASQAASS